MPWPPNSEDRDAPPASGPEYFFMPLIGAYDWRYAEGDTRHRRLYELAISLRWDVETDLDWHAGGNVLFDKAMPANQRAAIYEWLEGSSPWCGFEPYRRMPPPEKFEFYQREHIWHTNQFLHGEQGALIVSSQLCACAPTLDAKLFSASQVFDEARHVEFFTKYLHRRFPYSYPVSARLKALLDAIMAKPQWDIKLIGMQVIIEGLALAAFRIAASESPDPVLKQGLQLILRDESRHTNFGLQYLHDFLPSLAPHELAERQDFTAEACVIARDLMLPTPVFSHFSWPEHEAEAYAERAGVYARFQDALFATIIPQLEALKLIPEKGKLDKRNSSA